MNCGAIPEPLAESQLFGHLGGAFTGAHKPQPGVFRAAHGGTLFLDEIGELPAAVQPKLLRVLEDHVVTAVGGTAAVACDVRVVAATLRELPDEVAAGRFRGDLYARLADFPLRLPSLRERREDILPLFAAALPATARPTTRLVSALLLDPWPYNVRELLKVAAQIRLRAEGATVLDLDLLPERFAAQPAPNTAPATDGPASERLASERTPTPTREELIVLLKSHGGKVARVARAVGRSRRQVDRWLDELGLDAKSFH